MRATTLLILACAACDTQSADPSGASAGSVRERLETVETDLLVSSGDSAGSITAQRRVSGGWSAGYVDLHIERGELIASADSHGRITIEKLEVSLGPIDVPESVLGHGAQLTQVHLETRKPIIVQTTWTTEDEAHGTAQLALDLSWSLTVNGDTSPLGAPTLPPVPVELVVTGDGEYVHAEVRAQATGTFWSWADLVKLENLNLILGAATVSE
jgi:hypothetical protein